MTALRCSRKISHINYHSLDFLLLSKRGLHTQPPPIRIAGAMFFICDNNDRKIFLPDKKTKIPLEKLSCRIGHKEFK